VHAGVHDHHGPLGGHGVQVLHAHARAVEEDRVEAPPYQRLAGRQGAFGLAQPRGHSLETLQAFPQLAIGSAPVIEAHVHELPHAAFRQMAMPFDQAGHEHLVRIALVKVGWPPARQVFAAADAQALGILQRHLERGHFFGVGARRGGEGAILHRLALADL